MELRAKAGGGKQGGASAASAAALTEVLVWAAHTLVSMTLPIAVPVLVLHWTEGDVLPNVVLVLCAITLWMKLISYAQCNWDLRCLLCRSWHHAALAKH